MADVENPDHDGVATAEPDRESTCGLRLCMTVTVLSVGGLQVYLTTALQGMSVGSKVLTAGFAAFSLLAGVCLCAGIAVTCIAGNTDGEQQHEVAIQHIEPQQ